MVNEMKFEKTFDFGKIDYNGTGRRINKVTIDARLCDCDCDGKLMFSAMGGIWNSKSTDIVRGGQCFNAIAEFIKDPLFKKLYGWWKKYHLKTAIPKSVLNEMKSVLSCQS